MPYPNEHSCRLISPEAVIQCARTTRISDNKKYSVITCEWKAPPKAESHWAEQSYRYDKNVWTETEARQHCERHKGILFEPATGGIKKMDLSFMSQVRKRDIIPTPGGIFVREYPLIKQGSGSQYRKVFIPGHCVERTKAQKCRDDPWDGMKERSLYPIETITQRKALEKTCLYVFHVKKEDLPEDEPEGSIRLPPSHFAYIPPLCFHSDGALSSKALAHSFGVLAGARRRDGPTGWSGVNKLSPEDRRKAGRCIFLGLASLSKKCEVKFSDPPEWLELSEVSYRKYQWWRAEE